VLTADLKILKLIEVKAAVNFPAYPLLRQCDYDSVVFKSKQVIYKRDSVLDVTFIPVPVNLKSGFFVYLNTEARK